MVKFKTSAEFLSKESLFGSIAKTWDQFEYFIVVNKVVINKKKL